MMQKNTMTWCFGCIFASWHWLLLNNLDGTGFSASFASAVFSKQNGMKPRIGACSSRTCCQTECEHI